MPRILSHVGLRPLLFVLLLLASDASRSMTASDIIVDGGHLLYSL